MYFEFPEDIEKLWNEIKPYLSKMEDAPERIKEAYQEWLAKMHELMDGVM